MMKTVNLNTGGLDTLLQRSGEKGSLPNTSRYAWPTGNMNSGRNSSSNGSYPARSNKNSYFARNSPHPARVKHMKGLLDVPICTVLDADVGEDRPGSRFSVSTPNMDAERRKQLEGILKLPGASNRLKEKAIPSMGLVPMIPNWKEELTRLTEAINLPVSLPKAQPTNPMSGLPSRQGTRQGTRQGSRQASRDALRKMENEFVRNSLSRGGQRLSGEGPNQEGDRPPTRPSVTRDGNMNVVEQANEEFVLGLLTQILQTDSVQAIQNWLVNAPDREKQIVMDMIKAVSSSDEQLREGLQRIRNPAFETEQKKDEADKQRPPYEDQLLQHESSVDYEEIRKYNEAWKKEEEKLRQSKPKSILAKLDEQATEKDRKEAAYADYEWSANAAANKPSTPFKIFEKEKPRPGTAEAEIEDIRVKLASRSSVKVLGPQKAASRQGNRPTTQQGAKPKTSSPNNEKGVKMDGVKTVVPFRDS